MNYTATIYFLGKYRPIYIEDTSIAQVKIRLSHAIQETPPELRDWLSEHIRQVFSDFQRMDYSSVSTDHGDRGVALRKGPHDPWLSRLIADLPDCPGLNYNA